MTTRSFPTIVFMLALLASCAPMSPYEAVNSRALLKTVEEARTYKDHYALTKQFENLAEEMRTRANEQRKLLDHYQEKSYLYGRLAQDQQSHTWALMQRYEQAAKASLGRAALHRKIAARLEQEGYGTRSHQAAGDSAPQPNHNRSN